jgi:hypothetical protein
VPGRKQVEEMIMERAACGWISLSLWAYDRINCQFLEEMLVSRGFGPKWNA